MNTFGDETKQDIIKSESHKLHHEFEAGANLTKRQMVKLNSAGAIVALAADDDEDEHIGVVLHTVTTGKRATVAVRGYMIIPIEIAADSTVAGPVQMKGHNGTTKMDTVGASTAPAKSIGWLLEGGDDGDVSELLIKD